MGQQYKYFAFISYSSQDQAWGKRLQRKLEHYRLPATLCSKHGWERKPMKPVFFAPTDIQPGGLSEELRQRLQSSRYLIVICSPHSAQSEWVGKEIEYFHCLGRTKEIVFFIVDGSPHSNNPATECFNPVIKRLGIPEILGANIHERVYHWPWMNRERAYVQLVSKLLGVEFDAIWRRHRRLLVSKVCSWTVGIVAVIALSLGIRAANQSFDADVRLEETSPHNDQLPAMKDAVIILTLANESKTATVASLDDVASFTNIPHRFLNQEVYVTVTAKDFLSLDTTLALTPNLTLPIRRDSRVYGEFRFRIWSMKKECTFPGAEVSVDGHKAIADDSGYITLSLPLEKQRVCYHVTCRTPSVDGKLYVPCGPDAVMPIDE